MSKRPPSNDAGHDQTDLFGAAPAGSKTRRPAAPARVAQQTRSSSPARTAAIESPPDALLNVRQAAKRLGLSKSTLDKMRGAGKGPRFIRTTDRAIRYDPADLDQWINGRRSNSG